jgi:hypothetical protein
MYFSYLHYYLNIVLLFIIVYILYIKMELKMYNISSIENVWADMAQFFLIVRN